MRIKIFETAVLSLFQTGVAPQCSFSKPGCAFAGVPYQALAERLIRLAERERSNFKMPAVMMVFWALVRLEVPVSEAFLDGMAGALP